VRADIKIWQWPYARPTPPPILKERFACEKSGLVGKRVTPERLRGNGRLEILDSTKTDRYFTINNSVDHQRRFIGR
jgi:hypothetical protein